MLSSLHPPALEGWPSCLSLSWCLFSSIVDPAVIISPSVIAAASSVLLPSSSLLLATYSNLTGVATGEYSVCVRFSPLSSYIQAGRILLCYVILFFGLCNLRVKMAPQHLLSHASLRELGALETALMDMLLLLLSLLHWISLRHLMATFLWYNR